MSNVLMLSPSIYEIFLRCPKQAGFRLQKNLSDFVRRGTSAVLGEVAHRIIEEASKFSVSSNNHELSLWFDEKWESYLSWEFSKFQNQWYPNKVLQPKSWQGYYRVKTATKVLVMSRANWSVSAPSRVGARELKQVGKLTLPLVERHLEIPELRIHGRPDYVFEENGFAVIYDYKFGKEDLEINSQKAQLHFYVLLVEANTEYKVSRCAVLGGANKIREVPIDRNYLSKLKHEVERILWALENNKVAALPSMNNCLYCPFKSMCSPFLEANVRTPSGNPLALVGVIQHLSVQNDEFQEIQLSITLQGKLKTYRIVNIPRGYSLAIGEFICVGGRLHFHSPSLVEYQWNSQLDVFKENQVRG